MKLLFKQRLFSWFDSYDINFSGWHIDGGFMEWDYSITDENGAPVATVSKKLLHMTDTYVLDIVQFW